MENTPKGQSLFDFLSSVRQFLNRPFFKDAWVSAELAGISSSGAGHLYLELVERDGERVLAKTRGTIWANTANRLVAKFAEATGKAPEVGMRMLLRVELTYHEVYGPSLNIMDIDPAYTLGELERKRQETLVRLEAEGLFETNKQKPLPRVLQRLAVVASETSAGYDDFVQHLKDNPYAYSFSVQLFPAIVQGDEATASVAQAIASIDSEEFDAIVLIRGGGAKMDLACFDEYLLCEAVAKAPLPVIAGIGHERDESLADLVAHLSLKTPTAVANYLVDANAEFEYRIQQLAERLKDSVALRLEREERKLLVLENRLASGLKFSLQQKEWALERMVSRLQGVHPEALAQKGYYRLYGTEGIIKQLDDLSEGQCIELAMPEGMVKLEVKSINRNEGDKL